MFLEDILSRSLSLLMMTNQGLSKKMTVGSKTENRLFKLEDTSIG